MTIKNRIYRFGQGSEPRTYTVTAGVVQQTYTDYFGVVAVIKPNEPLLEESIETCGVVLPTSFCSDRHSRLGQAVKAPGGWLHVFNLTEEAAHAKAVALRGRLEKEVEEARRVELKAWVEEENRALAASLLDTKTSGDLLESLVGQRLLKFCRSKGDCLTLEFESETVELSLYYDGDSGGLTLERKLP